MFAVRKNIAGGCIALRYFQTQSVYRSKFQINAPFKPTSETTSPELQLCSGGNRACSTQCLQSFSSLGHFEHAKVISILSALLFLTKITRPDNRQKKKQNAIKKKIDRTKNHKPNKQPLIFRGQIFPSRKFSFVSLGDEASQFHMLYTKVSTISL